MEYESNFDATIRESGNSFVITVPKETIKKLKLKKEQSIEVAIRRFKEK